MFLQFRKYNKEEKVFRVLLSFFETYSLTSVMEE